MGEASEKTKVKSEKVRQDERALEKDLSARPFWQTTGAKNRVRSAELSHYKGYDDFLTPPRDLSKPMASLWMC